MCRHRFIGQGIVGLVAMFLAVGNSPACAVCFGAANSPESHALNAAIFMMLGVLVVVFSGVIGFVMHLGRRQRALFAASQSSTDTLGGVEP